MKNLRVFSPTNYHPARHLAVSAGEREGELWADW